MTLGLTVLCDGRHSPADAHDVWEQKPPAWPFVVAEAKAQLMLRMFGLSVAISPLQPGWGERQGLADANDAWASRGDAKQSSTDVHS